MGKKRRKHASQGSPSETDRTAMERLREVTSIVDKLKSFGLSKEIDGVARFFDIAREYVRTGESRTGSIPLHGLKRRLHFILTAQKHVACAVDLQYDDSV